MNSSHGQQSARVHSDCYPSLDEHKGGGAILNGHTTINNVLAECFACTPAVADEVFDLLRQKKEVLILQGEIKAVGPYGFGHAD